MPAESASPIGFVPTMGAFHEGHLELMRRAKAECGFCAVSIFVNPIQFGPGDDFQKYPRPEEKDLRLAEETGVDFVFAPTVEEMYASGDTQVRVGAIGERWEGEFRPGHFDGVATVVAKLFNIVTPHRAYFGRKDFQQCAVIRQMVADLDFRLELRFVETLREPDGLALSSRNIYFSPEQRRIAPTLSLTLSDTASRLAQDPGDAKKVLDYAVDRLHDAGFETDYFAWVDGETLEPISAYRDDSRLIAAARLGTTRLIDNCAV